MPKFEPKYVRLMWADELEGKMVFFADSISNLKGIVENNISRYYGKAVQVEKYSPFKMEYRGEPWTFCYYDPYYEFKWAHEQGKTIQALFSGNIWVNIEEPSWIYSPEDYRIKPEEPKESKPITNRELSKWLAQGNGECSYRSGDLVRFTAAYSKGEEDIPIEGKIRIRKWEDSEWHEPSRQYMGLEE